MSTGNDKQNFALGCGTIIAGIIVLAIFFEPVRMIVLMPVYFAIHLYGTTILGGAP